MYPTSCSVCGSAKMIPNVQVVDTNENVSRDLQARVAQKPEALVFKEHVYRPLRAWICGDCGHVELFVPNPQGLYEAYLVSLTAKSQ
jgi:hypothetical protein